MELLVLDTDFTSLGIVDVAESIIWKDRYSKYGDFEIYLPSDSEFMKLFKMDRYIRSNESEHVMIIESVNITTDSDEGSHMVVTGRSLESILGRRVIKDPTSIQGNFQDSVEMLLNNSIISPSDPNRKISNFRFKRNPDQDVTSKTYDAQYFGDNLYTVISEACEVLGLGFKVTLSNDNYFEFSLYCGKDRSYAQTSNSYVVFSPDFENLMESTYTESTLDYKNSAIVVGNYEDTELVVVEVYEGESVKTGLDRREYFEDATSVSSSSDGAPIPQEDFRNILMSNGTEALSENRKENVFDGKVDTRQTYVYGKDYYIGDLVQIVNEYGIGGTARIIETINSKSNEDDTGLYPTFSVQE